MSEQELWLRLRELCEDLQLSQEACVELVDHGIVRPRGERPEEWQFDITSVSIVRRAVRLRRDLHLEWSAVAVVVNLLEERDALRDELDALQLRLNRFMND